MAQNPYARGKYAIAICDVCGFRYKLSELRYTFVQGKNTHIKACPKCWDPDHPQNFLPQAVKQHGYDAEQLHDPRPDVYPVAYPVKYSPAVMAPGDVATVYATGVFAGYSVTVASDDLNITISSVVLVGATRVMMVVTAGISTPAGAHIITITDANGNPKKGLMTIS